MRYEFKNDCYMLWISYNPDYINPLTGKSGQYRVAKRQNVGKVIDKKFYISSLTFPFIPRIVMHSSKNYPRGSIVNPTKILRELLQSEKIEYIPQNHYYSLSEC